MERKLRKVIGRIVTVLLILTLAIYGGRYFFFTKIREAVLEEIDDLQKSGFQIRYDSLTSSFWANEVHINHLDIQYSPLNNTCGVTAMRMTADEIKIHGIEILPLIFKKELHANALTLKNPFFRYSRNIQPWNRSVNPDKKLNGIFLDHFQMTSASFEVSDSNSCKVNSRGQFSLTAANVCVKSLANSSMDWTVGNIVVAGLKLQFPEKFYTITVKELAYERLKKSIRMDSLLILPDYDKAIFAQKGVVQTDRVEGSIPYLNIAGVEIETSGKLAFKARRADLNFDLALFRDKRYPLAKKTKSLPSRALQDFGVKIQIDTLQLSKSTATYEEFPEDGNQSGKVSFNDLNATVHNISNSSDQNTFMHAQARFMNSGDLRADFIFPSDPQKPYSVKGRLINFNMKGINGMLVPVAHAEVRSGLLESLKFQFEYNDFRSDGELSIAYSDLDLISLNKSSNNTLNKLATFILKTFVVKKEVRESKSQGIILFYRDPHRSVFNYWWKSILSGIKSVYNLDKITDTHHIKEK